MRRIFIEPEETDGRIINAGKEARDHALNVLRMKEGDLFGAVTGTGLEYEARIVSFGKSGMQAEIVSCHRREKTGISIDLYVCMIKPSRFETFLEKTAEIGVDRIIPVISERTQNFEISKSRRERWLSIIKQASRQSCSIMPSLEEALSLNDAIDGCREGLILIPDPAAESSWRDILGRIAASDRASVFIGPEGGFSESELLYAQSKGAVKVLFGESILRTETAAIAAASILRHVV
ncbi:MAG: 16S rRNA (uracil(1498)-N(3))-methyltransferase [bacterium]|nr:16S rRNA (uracil(1498)-N(3))-methyltransferase [bacterium]